MSTITNYLQPSGFSEVCCLGILKRRFKSIAGILTVVLFLFATNTTYAQCEDGSACAANYDPGVGNGYETFKAKLYCSNSGAVENGLINCTTAADTDGCGIDASQSQSMVAEIDLNAQFKPGVTYGDLFSGASIPTNQYVQWIVFATPPTVQGTKIQAVGASDSWFLFHAGAFTNNQAKETADIPFYGTVMDALTDPALNTSFGASDLVDASDRNQYQAWTNDDAVIGSDIYNVYYIALSYNRPTNGSLNFKVKECEIGCEPAATCNISNLDLICEDDFPAALTNPNDVFSISEDCGNTPVLSSSDSSVSTNGDVRSIVRTYSLTINGSVVISCPQTITITDTELDITGSVTNVDCNGNSTGAIDITINNGSGIYTYDWSNGEMTEDISGLTAGNYSVTVTDENGCTGTYETTITEPADIVLTVNSTDVTCNGAADGTITASATGG
ncbi:SprB repeat-containing protein, partial [Winogradskyella sp. A3E31]|uniref:SprB repeat-containing protein n=1 Tax=Winogradskyella sp. A3E31 TaxID=3349637 RepID=UPI00398B0E53